VEIDEEELFETYFRGYAAQVHAFALRRAEPEAAHDATGETFLIAWRRRAEMPPEPLPWLYGIARRVLANEQRAANRRFALITRIAAQPTPPDGAAACDRDILEALAALRAIDREALLLTAWEGLSAKEAATVVGCSTAALAVRLHRARRRLARLLIEMAAADEAGSCKSSIPEVSG
jgi:RNA polymerase sigma-70 factor (ECF subfamily)